MSARSKDPGSQGGFALVLQPQERHSSAEFVDAGELLGAGAGPALPLQAGGASVGVAAAPEAAEQGLNPSTEETRAGLTAHPHRTHILVFSKDLQPQAWLLWSSRALQSCRKVSLLLSFS